MIRELILQMKRGHVDSTYFQGKFGIDIRERFAGPFGKLRHEGFLAPDGSHGGDVRLNREGLLQVDTLLYEFFLPEHPLRERAGVSVATDDEPAPIPMAAAH